MPQRRYRRYRVPWRAQTPFRRAMRKLPQPHEYCIIDKDEGEPLICSKHFQEMFELPTEDIPPDQGVNRHGSKRRVVCNSKAVVSQIYGAKPGGDPAPKRDDGYPIVQIAEAGCENRTMGKAWKTGYWVDEPEDLAALGQWGKPAPRKQGNGLGLAAPLMLGGAIFAVLQVLRMQREEDG